MTHEKTIGPALLISATDRKGKEYPEDDWRQRHIGRLGILHLFKSSKGMHYYAVSVYLNGDYFSTSRIEDIEEGEIMKITTQNSVYYFMPYDLEDAETNDA